MKVLFVAESWGPGRFAAARIMRLFHGEFIHFSVAKVADCEPKCRFLNRISCGKYWYSSSRGSRIDADSRCLDVAVIQPQFLTKRGRHFTPKTVQKNDKFQTPKTRHFWTLKMARKPLRIPYEMPPQNGLKKHTENRHFLDPQNNTFWK